MNISLKENAIKNLLVFFVGVAFLPTISSSIQEVDPTQFSDFILVLSMLLVTVCFANFAFTYEKSRFSTTTGKFLAHMATGIFALLIFLMLATTCLVIKEIYPSLFVLTTLFSLLLYIGVVLYDFWDFFRVEG